jgi:hypothetical protein
VQLSSVDESVDIGGVATVILFGLLLTSAMQKEPNTKQNGREG